MNAPLSMGMSIFVIVGTVLTMIATLWLIGWSSKQGPQNLDDKEELGHRCLFCLA